MVRNNLRTSTTGWYTIRPCYWAFCPPLSLPTASCSGNLSAGGTETSPCSLAQSSCTYSCMLPHPGLTPCSGTMQLGFIFPCQYGQRHNQKHGHHGTVTAAFQEHVHGAYGSPWEPESSPTQASKAESAWVMFRRGWGWWGLGSRGLEEPAR